MPPTLKLFRSLWGATPDWETLFPRLKAQGYEGIEASLSDLLSPPTPTSATKSTDRFFTLLQASNLNWICGLYTSWDDYIGDWDASTNMSVDHHVKQFQSQLSRVVHELPVVPVHINSHTGSDCLSEAETEEMFKRILQVQRELMPILNERLEGTGRAAVALSHETHRGRALFSPWSALRVAKTFPEVRFTLDLSHWTVVSERVLPLAVLGPILERTLHVHARVGSPQHSQVDDPASEKDREWTEAYLETWKEVWRRRSGETGGDCFVTPEYGPVGEGGYMREAVVVMEGTGGVPQRRPLLELEALVQQEANRLVAAFSSMEWRPY
ncbi:hypothetical protein HDU67_005402 [Dinochytrium kinnereticum]|nr:hypothetical protein HDU67_005402 [Dinochytrium kinnereticum]